VSVTVARDVTERVKPPRAVFVPFRMGHHFGVPFHSKGQRLVITAALDLISGATHSGQILDLPMRWAELRREGVDIERRTAG
jgi:D-proline reductase (dithiol) PrdB